MQIGIVAFTHFTQQTKVQLTVALNGALTEWYNEAPVKKIYVVLLAIQIWGAETIKWNQHYQLSNGSKWMTQFSHHLPCYFDFWAPKNWSTSPIPNNQTFYFCDANKIDF